MDSKLYEIYLWIFGKRLYLSVNANLFIDQYIVGRNKFIKPLGNYNEI